MLIITEWLLFSRPVQKVIVASERQRLIALAVRNNVHFCIQYLLVTPCVTDGARALGLLKIHQKYSMSFIRRK